MKTFGSYDNKPYICTIKITDNIISAMKATVNLSLTDYMAIAAMLVDNTPAHTSTYEVEYRANGYTLYIEAAYSYDYTTCRGDYYTPAYTEITAEEYDVLAFECLDSEGEPIETDFTAAKLLEILN